jgi:2-hydroxychromene-2-carboxylate isomerase
MARLTFWYEFASTYSYLSVMRISDVAAAAGVEVRWQPFLLGPIFKAQGWDTSPFNIYPAKGRYMVRDIERIAAARGLKFRMPEPFPANGLKAARLASAGMDEGWAAPFSMAVFEAQFAQDKDIASEPVLVGLLETLGIDAEAALAQAGGAANKERLREATAEAQRLGIFGAPSFVTEDGELFWGDDRLDMALAHARQLVGAGS